MTKRRSKEVKKPTKDYLEKAKALSKEDAERLMTRMRGRYTRRLEDKKYSSKEALALQLEFEDEQLAQWRKQVAKIRNNRKG